MAGDPYYGARKHMVRVVMEDGVQAGGGESVAGGH